MHTSRTALVTLALVATGAPARADLMALGFKPIAVTVTFEKTGPGNLVAYPSDCHVSQLDFKLNPHLKFEQTYDAVEVVAIGTLLRAAQEALSSRLEALHLNPGDHVFRAGDVAFASSRQAAHARDTSEACA